MSTKSARSLTRLTSYLMSYDPDMNMVKLHLFLLVAAGKDVLVRDLRKATGLAQSTIARNLATLGDRPMRGNKDGLGWVKSVEDPEDSRRTFTNITPKGRKVLAEIESMID